MRDDIGFIKDYKFWPIWPFMPVKKRSKTPGGWPTCGTLVCESLDEGPKPIVYVGTPYAGKDFDRTIIAQYATLEEMVADGWIVD